MSALKYNKYIKLISQFRKDDVYPDTPNLNILGMSIVNIILVDYSDIFKKPNTIQGIYETVEQLLLQYSKENKNIITQLYKSEKNKNEEKSKRFCALYEQLIQEITLNYTKEDLNKSEKELNDYNTFINACIDNVLTVIYFKIKILIDFIKENEEIANE